MSALPTHPASTSIASSQFRIPFKPRIIRLLDSHPYSAQQIFQRLREEGYRGFAMDAHVGDGVEPDLCGRGPGIPKILAQTALGT
jgi:hypothetical protein